MKKIILPDIISVGIYNAQVVFKNKAVSPNRKTTMFEIELPLGDGGMSYIDNTSHQISENVIICAKPGQIRHTKLPFRCYYVHIMVNEGQIFDTLSSLPNYIDIENTKDIQEIFISLCKYFDLGNPEDDILLQSLILKLVHTLHQAAPTAKLKHSPKSNNHKVIEKAVEHINTNLASDLSLENLSESFNYTPIYFHKLFKASTGKTLREYVEEQRLRKAIELMLSTEMTLTQIAYECGFSSQSYFNYAFKKKMGHSPREYVKNILLQYDKSGTSF